MLNLRKSEERGHIRHDGIESFHTFSFSHYFDPQQVGYRCLRVINEEIFSSACSGYGRHPHKNLELLIFVLEGELKHYDSVEGSDSILPAGTLRVMNAGRELVHGEGNAREDIECRMLEVWLEPALNDLEPRAQTIRFDEPSRDGKPKLIVSPDGRQGSVPTSHQYSVTIHDLKAQEKSRHFPEPGRGTWIQQIEGEIEVNQRTLHPGDGAAIEKLSRIVITARSDARFLLFDLP